VFFTVLGFFFGFEPGKTSYYPPVANESTVVVELFTSQGCSSCPAADDLFNEMIEKSDDSRPIIGLSFHVSYWNYLGWKDPYSSEEFTNRQKKYAHVLQLESIYTPQMIVNGEFEFVGSDRTRLRSAIDQGLRESPVYRIQATATLNGREALIKYSIDKEPKNELLNIALVDSRVQNRVLRGENQGKTLQHDNVVRELKTIDLARTGEARMVIAVEGTSGPASSIILYIQNRATLKILSAVKINKLSN